jgi:hypothetical protein
LERGRVMGGSRMMRGIQEQDGLRRGEGGRGAGKVGA